MEEIERPVQRVHDMLDRLSQLARERGERDATRITGDVLDVMEMVVDAVADFQRSPTLCDCPNCSGDR